ncbi:PREDICTED: DNA mismatch repair protein MLH3 [Tarenaya hassleriana]|uniref:DNA mismatch repair protein MLH3 n=1 Tax=Tarenaya hassleriana TaxID=28532 RepID=UPI00053C0FA5|nr:PREDICTED: DNA mismatch repair protein MLH3 [Tarenaya hassleriana]
MKTIKPLPEHVRHSVRSGVIMFDMTKVVEELVFNSLDAGATKISIFVGVVTCCVKVVDDGSGICRDDLVLLGERYATSKFQDFTDLGSASESIGFRGEALASISDISLMEITTKAIGKPNGYRKVMKGSKCLYLGIDDERKDCGTTVIVRDLFYNQPVRRKYMSSSHKKVLDFIKKCVLRIALVHSDVSFSVLDIESDEEIFQASPSSSALSLLMRGCGTEASNSFRKVYGSDGMMNISGYISVPGESFAMKAFQCVYINLRFVSKGPIHKLLNHLAASLECSDPWKFRDGLQTGKRNRSQSNPAYILCITCPGHLYDFSFEPSKTYIEFKNWEPVLAFIEKVILALWKKDTSLEFVDEGADLPAKGKRHKVADEIIVPKEDCPGIVEPTRKKFKRNNNQMSSNILLPHFHNVNRDDDSMSSGNDAWWSPHFEFENKSGHLNEQTTGGEFDHQTDTHLRSLAMEMGKRGDLPQVLDANDFMEASFAAVMRSRKHSSERFENSSHIDYAFRKVSEGLSLEFGNFNNGLDINNCTGKNLLRGCSSRGNLTLHEPTLAHDPVIRNDKGNEWLAPVIETKQDGFWCDAFSDAFGFCQRSTTSDCALGDLGQGDGLFTPQGFQYSKSIGIGEDSNNLPKDAEEFHRREDTSVRKKYASVAQVGNSSVKHCCFGSELSHLPFDPPSEIMWDCDDHNRCEMLEGRLRLQRKPESGKFFREDDHINFIDDIVPQMYCQETSATVFKNSLIDVENYTHPDENFSVSFWRHTNNLGIEQDNIRKNKFSQRGGTENNVCKRSSRRSHSAPPFYRCKKRFVSLSCSEIKSKNSDPSCSYHVSSFKELDDLYCQTRSSGASHRHPGGSILNDVLYHRRQDTEKRLSSASDLDASNGCRTVPSEPKKVNGIRDFISEESLDPVEPITKWRHKHPVTKVSNGYHEFQDIDSVLDISSGLLHRLGDESLVPESMNRDSLEDAKVLQQVDKKFIPVVASGMLAIIDQHAADERIRLEELREKVLAGEARTVTHLDAEQELALPEMGYQLLQSYSEQIRNWGWICNINAQGTTSFKKDMSIIRRQQNQITLQAVPCILGVNLSEDDLSEFLQQLADTDGSSTIPPSVLRVLNSKACRGAIMFGDSLLPSECSLIVEELKQTSLCFQCAHGRPTTVPLVNLKALHKQVAKLSPNQAWHGLQREVIALGRAKARLNASRS